MVYPRNWGQFAENISNVLDGNKIDAGYDHDHSLPNWPPAALGGSDRYNSEEESVR